MSREIIYIYDALCGWCYGFSPVIKQLNLKYAPKVSFTVLSGGMVTGSRVAPLAHMAAYIAQAHVRVEQMTGVKFGEAFLAGRLQDSTYISDSLPPSVALSVFKSLLPGQSVDFAHDIQQSFYGRGESLNDLATYLKLLPSYGIDPGEFAARFASEQYRAQAQAEFAQVQGWGVTGFPTLVFRDGNQLYALARGYRDFASLDALVGELLAKPTPEPVAS
jgi:putative protein-disulfide isomerase